MTTRLTRHSRCNLPAFTPTWSDAATRPTLTATNSSANTPSRIRAHSSALSLATSPWRTPPWPSSTSTGSRPLSIWPSASLLSSSASSSAFTSRCGSDAKDAVSWLPSRAEPSPPPGWPKKSRRVALSSRNGGSKAGSNLGSTLSDRNASPPPLLLPRRRRRRSASLPDRIMWQPTCRSGRNSCLYRRRRRRFITIVNNLIRKSRKRRRNSNYRDESRPIPPSSKPPPHLPSAAAAAAPIRPLSPALAPQFTVPLPASIGTLVAHTITHFCPVKRPTRDALPTTNFTWLCCWRLLLLLYHFGGHNRVLQEAVCQKKKKNFFVPPFPWNERKREREIVLFAETAGCCRWINSIFFWVPSSLGCCFIFFITWITGTIPHFYSLLPSWSLSLSSIYLLYLISWEMRRAVVMMTTTKYISTIWRDELFRVCYTQREEEEKEKKWIRNQRWRRSVLLLTNISFLVSISLRERLDFSLSIYHRTRFFFFFPRPPCSYSCRVFVRPG